MNNKGFTLIEVLLSVFILTVAVLGLYNGIDYSYNSVKKAKDKFIAAYLAEEGVELVKNLRDSNFVARTDPWTTGLICTDCKIDMNDNALSASGSTTFLQKDANGLYGYALGGGVNTIFSRSITVTTVDADKIKVVVTVSYGDEDFELQQYLYNWF